MPDPRIEALASALADHEPLLAAPDDSSAVARSGPLARASVALLVRPAAADLELLVIQRATRAGDPWSGHMAFPGGRRSVDDRSAREAAERETYEEVGIELSRVGTPLGRLDQVWPQSGAPAIVVSPFVFSVPLSAELDLNHEVSAAFWIALRDLAAPGAATEYLHALASGEELRFPAIAYESHVIWGLTHRIMTGFLHVVRQVLDGGGAT